MPCKGQPKNTNLKQIVKKLSTVHSVGVSKSVHRKNYLRLSVLGQTHKALRFPSFKHKMSGCCFLKVPRTENNGQRKMNSISTTNLPLHEEPMATPTPTE